MFFGEAVLAFTRKKSFLATFKNFRQA